jgi:putative hydrolase of the HAD superfamily
MTYCSYLPHPMCCPRRRILLVTKGDLLDQERKLAQSGLGGLFDGVEIVSDKSAPVYTSIFNRHGVAPADIMMVGNSMKSDVVPPIEAGAWGTYVPHNHTWELERAPAPHAHPRFHQLPSLLDLPELITRLEG